MYLIQVSLLLIDQLGLVDFFSSDVGPCFPLAGGLCKFYANAGGKRPIQRQPLLLQYKQQANPLLSMNNYTPLVISRNDNNKQLTLISQRKLALTEKIRKWLCKFGGTSKTIKNQARRFFRPISINVCHQKPNSARETVPFKFLLFCCTRSRVSFSCDEGLSLS